MTKSSTPQTDLTTPQPRRSRFNWGQALLVFIFRLLLLGVSGSLAALLGIAIAQLYPGRVEEPPLAEKLLRGSQAVAKNIQEINQPQETTPTPSSTTASPSPITTLPPTVSPSLPPPPLSDEQRQQLQTELTQLQTELQQLNSRATAIEGQVGIQETTASLEERLQVVQRQLDPNAPAPSPVAPAESPGFVAPVPSTVSDSDQLMVTLPSDALFVSNQTTLRPETTAILDSIIGDLRAYPGATIQIAAHTDSQGAVAEDRSRSFDQATVVEQYLANQLGANYRWIVLGYGSSRPLVENSSDINRQRNRRIEITITPD